MTELLLIAYFLINTLLAVWANKVSKKKDPDIVFLRTFIFLMMGLPVMVLGFVFELIKLTVQAVREIG